MTFDKTAYMRDYMRKKRAGNVNSKNKLLVEIQNAQDLLLVLEYAINDVLDCGADTLVRARTLGYLVGVSIKVTEQCDLLERIVKLEEKAKK